MTQAPDKAMGEWRVFFSPSRFHGKDERWVDRSPLVAFYLRSIRARDRESEVRPQ